MMKIYKGDDPPDLKVTEAEDNPKPPGIAGRIKSLFKRIPPKEDTESLLPPTVPFQPKEKSTTFVTQDKPEIPYTKRISLKLYNPEKETDGHDGPPFMFP